MASNLLSEYLGKFKSRLGKKITTNKTFPNDEERNIENVGLPTVNLGVSDLVSCKGEPSSFWMDNEIKDKTRRKESEDSLLKFAVRFSNETDHTSSSGESDTSSRRHHARGNNIHGHNVSKLENANSTTDDESMRNDNTTNQNDIDYIADQLNSDSENIIDQSNPDMNDRGAKEPSDTLSASEHDGDDKSITSSSSVLQMPNANFDGELRDRQANGDRVNNENEAEESDTNNFQTPTGFLESYLYIIQFLGVSAFRRAEYRNLNVVVAILFKILFWIVSTWAFLNSLKILKHVAIEQAPDDKDLKYCVTIGFAMIRCFSRFYFIKLVGTEAVKLSVMLLHVRNLRFFTKNGNFSFSILALILATTTFIFTVTKVCGGYLPLSNWNWIEALKLRTYLFSNTLFAWSSDSNVIKSLEASFYDANQTQVHVAMGLLDGFLDFCGTLQGEAIRDLLILAGLTILIDQKCFEKRIKPQLLVHPNNTDSAEVESSLRHFKSICEESSSINDVFVTIFKFVSIQNLLLYAYLFIQLIEYDNFSMNLISSIVDAFRGLLLFYIGMQLHWKNSNIKKWLHRMSSYTGPIDVETILGMSVQSAIAEFREDPIGLGNDYFLVNETFIVGLIAAVGSLISLLFEFDKQDKTAAIIRRLLL